MAKLSLSGISVVESFAESLGLEARPAADGSYNFVFERAGTLSILPTDREQGALIALARPPQSNAAEFEARLLAAGGINSITNQLIYTALADDGSHLFAVDFNETSWSLPRLDETLRLLRDLHDTIL